jgi:hypothetical protein
MVRRGGSLVALMIIFCILGAAYTFDIPAVAQNNPKDATFIAITTVTVVATTTVVPENVSICVIRLGIEEPNGTVLWIPGYGYPGLLASQCQNKTGYYTDALGQTIAIHQYLRTMIVYTTVVVTMTETSTGSSAASILT